MFSLKNCRVERRYAGHRIFTHDGISSHASERHTINVMSHMGFSGCMSADFSESDCGTAVNIVYSCAHCIFDVKCSQAFARSYCFVCLQILKSKYDMGYLAPTWLGKRWQPFYQELLDLAGITSKSCVSIVDKLSIACFVAQASHLCRSHHNPFATAQWHDCSAVHLQILARSSYSHCKSTQKTDLGTQQCAELSMPASDFGHNMSLPWSWVANSMHSSSQYVCRLLEYPGTVHGVQCTAKTLACLQPHMRPRMLPRVPTGGSSLWPWVASQPLPGCSLGTACSPWLTPFLALVLPSQAPPPPLATTQVT